jgi:protein-S-isoprenylcysteine O-methyltransferase Ste14
MTDEEPQVKGVNHEGHKGPQRKSRLTLLLRDALPEWAARLLFGRLRGMRAFIPAIFIAVAVLLLYLFIPGLKEQPWTALRIGGAVLAVVTYALVVAARIQLGKSFSVRPEARELITHGLYARIRNPMYVFLDLMVLGLILSLELYWVLVILAVLVVFQVRQARREAGVLLAKFGQAYLDYRKQTWF